MTINNTLAKAEESERKTRLMDARKTCLQMFADVTVVEEDYSKHKIGSMITHNVINVRNIIFFFLDGLRFRNTVTMESRLSL